MATRHYLQSSGSPDISPTVDAGWERTSPNFVRRKSSTTKASTAMASVSHTDSNQGANEDVVLFQFISDEVYEPVTFSGTVRLQIRAQETDSNNNMFTDFGVRAVSADGTTDLGTILAITRDGTEINPASLQSRSHSTTPSGTIASAFRLLMEVGAGGDPGGASPTHSFTLRVGDTAGSDLANDDTSTTDNNPYIEFSQTLTIYTAPTGRVQRLMTQGVG